MKRTEKGIRLVWQHTKCVETITAMASYFPIILSHVSCHRTCLVIQAGTTSYTHLDIVQSDSSDCGGSLAFLHQHRPGWYHKQRGYRPAWMLILYQVNHTQAEDSSVVMLKIWNELLHLWERLMSISRRRIEKKRKTTNFPRNLTCAHGARGWVDDDQKTECIYKEQTNYGK